MLWKYALCAFMHELMGSHNNLLAMGFFKPLWAWTYHLSLGPMGQYMASQWTLKISILMRVNLSPFVVTFKRKFQWFYPCSKIYNCEFTKHAFELAIFQGLVVDPSTHGELVIAPCNGFIVDFVYKMVSIESSPQIVIVRNCVQGVDQIDNVWKANSNVV